MVGAIPKGRTPFTFGRPELSVELTIEAGYTRVYRAVSEAEYQDIVASGQLRQGPNSLEGKWFAGSRTGCKAHGRALHPNSRFLLIEVDIPNDAKSLFFDVNLDGRGPAFYLHNDDLPLLRPRPLE